MTKDAKTVITWTYQPKGFFEEPYEFMLPNGKISISEGSVKGEFDSASIEQRRELLRSVSADVGNLFRAQQFQVQRVFELSGPSITLEYEDGGRGAVVVAKSGMSHSIGSRGRVTIQRVDGEIIMDSEVSRIQETQRLLEDVISLSDDSILERMLCSFSNAIDDPNNRFFHLYEIRDTLEEVYGRGQKQRAEKVRTALGISKDDWSKFGRLANNEPLTEGRHRGKQGDGLRPATRAEIEWAQSFARSLIKKYIAAKTGK